MIARWIQCTRSAQIWHWQCHCDVTTNAQLRTGTNTGTRRRCQTDL